MVNKITFNWHQVGDMESGFGEDYDFAEVGKIDSLNKMEVLKIWEHKNEKTKGWYYDIEYVDGSSTIVFNPNLVFRIRK